MLSKSTASKAENLPPNITRITDIYSMQAQYEKTESSDSVMDEWLRSVYQGYEMYCHDLEVKGSNPSRVELVVHSVSV